jgi:hypothetical protein
MMYRDLAELAPILPSVFTIATANVLAVGAGAIRLASGDDSAAA